MFRKLKHRLATSLTRWHDVLRHGPEAVPSDAPSQEETALEIAGQMAALLGLGAVAAVGFVTGGVQTLFSRSGRVPETGGTRRILLVEDDPAFREVLAELLSALGYATHIATNSQEALKILSLSGFAAMIVDSLHGEGFSVIQTACELYPRMPIVFLTGDVTITRDQLGPKSCNATVLHKPVPMATLQAELTRAIQKAA